MTIQEMQERLEKEFPEERIINFSLNILVDPKDPLNRRHKMMITTNKLGIWIHCNSFEECIKELKANLLPAEPNKENFDI